MVHIGGKNLQRGPALEAVARLQKQHRDGVSLLPRGRSRYPDPDGALALGGFHQGSDSLFSQDVEGLRVAKEARHRDQHLLAQGQHFIAVVFQQLQVLVQLRSVAGLHAPLQATHDGGGLVIGEIDAAELVEQLQNLGEHIVIGQGRVGCYRQHRAVVVVGFVQEMRHQAQRQFFGRKHVTHHTGGNGAAWHAIKLARLRLLRHEKTASSVDRDSAPGSIGAGARQNDADRFFPKYLGQGGKENVDRQRQTLRLFGLEVQMPRRHMHDRAGRDQEHMVGL